MIWFTADIHYNHKNVLQYCNRPFKTIEDMNHTLIENHNSVVSDEDDVYILGDITLGSFYTFLHYG